MKRHGQQRVSSLGCHHQILRRMQYCSNECCGDEVTLFEPASVPLKMSPSLKEGGNPVSKISDDEDTWKEKTTKLFTGNTEEDVVVEQSKNQPSQDQSTPIDIAPTTRSVFSTHLSSKERRY